MIAEPNTLVCVLTDQHVPNLLSVKKFRPKRLVLVASGRMREKAVPFLLSLKSGGLDYSGDSDTGSHFIIDLRNENLIPAIHEDIAAGLAAIGSHENLVVNISGGTKLIGIGLYTFFAAKGARIIYTPANAPECFIDTADQSGTPVKFLQNDKPLLTLDEFLLGYGFSDKESKSNLDRKEERALDSFDCALGIAMHAESEDLLNITDDERRLLRNGRAAPGQLRLSGFGERVKQLGYLDGLMRKNKLDRYDGEFLTGGWAEHFVFGLLHKHSKTLNLEGLRTGSKIAPRGATDNDNELDACCMRGTTAWIFECKSGSQENDRGVDALYKLEAVCRQVRALHAKPVFVTTGINIYEKGTASGDSSQVLKPGIKERIQAFGVNLVDLPQILSLAKAHDDVSVTGEILFGDKAAPRGGLLNSRNQ